MDQWPGIGKGPTDPLVKNIMLFTFVSQCCGKILNMKQLKEQRASSVSSLRVQFVMWREAWCQEVETNGPIVSIVRQQSVMKCSTQLTLF